MDRLSARPVPDAEDTTTNYWASKFCLTLRECQDTIILGGKVFIDETFYKLRKEDIQTREDGLQYRGLSCIGIGCDLCGHVSCTIEGNGKTSAKTMDAFLHHIEPGSILVHDTEKSHAVLVNELGE